MTPEQIVEIKFNSEKDSRPVVLALVTHIEEQTELTSRALRELVRERDEARTENERLRAEVPQCNGKCLRASDVLDDLSGVVGNPVARAHRSCPRHGDLATVAEELDAALSQAQAEAEKLRTEISDAADALSDYGRDAYATAGSLEDGINTDHMHAAADLAAMRTIATERSEACGRAEAEIERLRNLHSSAWADVRALLVEHRDSATTDNELTNTVMAIFSPTDDQPGGSR